MVDRRYFFCLGSPQEEAAPAKEADSVEKSAGKTDWWTGSDYNGRKYPSPKVRLFHPRDHYLPVHPPGVGLVGRREEGSQSV